MFGGRFRKWFFARCLLPGASGRHERLVEGRKRGLFAILGPGQTVVELGPGTGPNFAYFPASIRWLGVEPNPYLRQRLLEDRSREVFESTKDVPSGIADAVISTLGAVFGGGSGGNAAGGSPDAEAGRRVSVPGACGGAGRLR